MIIPKVSAEKIAIWREIRWTDTVIRSKVI